MSSIIKRIVVIGGGIAGLSAIEGLLQEYDEAKPQFSQIYLISASRLVKRVNSYSITGRNLEKFSVTEENLVGLDLKVPANLEFKSLVGYVRQVDNLKKVITLFHTAKSQELNLSYDVLCICTGSIPKQLDLNLEGDKLEISKRSILIRDTDSVKDLKEKLSGCRRVAIVGNGGISLELVSKITDCEKVWIIRDNYIGLNFFDSGAAKFILDSLKLDDQNKKNQGSSAKSSYSMTPVDTNTQVSGPSIGPEWLQDLKLIGNSLNSSNLDIIYDTEVESISFLEESEFPLKIKTCNNQQVECDLLVTAIGVVPNTIKFVDDNVKLSPDDGGILVDREMRTNLSGVYAAGDVVSCNQWQDTGDLWFQMRLWTQARQLGFYSGRCIVSHLMNRNPLIYSNFDCFTHCTSFFDFKLVLIGRYNGQFITNEETSKSEILVSVSPGEYYVKLVILDGKIVGSVLLGESGIEETIENLICDKIDVSNFKDHLLDGTIDIEDYFD